MGDVLISSEKLLDRLGHEELELKKLGLVNQAAGVRVAITLLIKQVLAVKDAPSSIDPSGEFNGAA